MSMSDRDGFIWYDGEMVPWRNATTHVLTHTLHYGMGVFEGVRAYKTVAGTAVFKLKEHTDRLFDSAHIYRMPMPYDKETILQSVHKTGRLLVVDEGFRYCGYGSEIISMVCENALEALDERPRQFTTMHTTIPFSVPLDDYVFPNPDKMANEIRAMLGTRATVGV